MSGVEKISRTRYYLGEKRVAPGTPGARKVVEVSKDYYAVIYDGKGKRHRFRLEGITTRAKAEEKRKCLIAEAQRGIREDNARSPDLIEDLISDYEKRLHSTGIKKKTIKDEIDKVRTILVNELQVIRLGEVNISNIQENLQDSVTTYGGRKPRPRSARTKNYYIGTLIRFGKWLKENKHWRRNLFVRLKKFRGSQVKVRRDMTQEEITLLFQTAQTRGVRSGTKEQGEERAVFYAFLFYTLSRYGSARSILVGQLDFTKGQEEVMLRGDQVKNKKTVSKPLHPLLVQKLQAWIKKKKLKPTDKLFPGIKSNLINQFNLDLKKAGIQKVLPNGTSLDIHSFKTTAISMLHDSGVPLKVIQELAEHSNPQTTLNHYVRTNKVTLAQAFLHLPKLGYP